MDNNLSVEKIKSYSIDFSNSVCNTFFRINNKISGNQILTLTPLKQINLFILKNLFVVWEKESEKLKSNYFDYESENVKNALHSFLNVLSQNISINRSNFEPLLIQSVYDTLLLILSPYDYYRMEISAWKGKISMDKIRKESKYIQINKHLIDALLERLETKDFGELDTAKLLFIFDEVCERTSDSPEDIDQFFNLLEKIKPVSSREFYQFTEQPPVINSPKKEDETSEHKKILAETFVVNAQTLNEKFGSDAKTTLAEKLQKGKIQSIKSSIPINQKFVYINNLFDGDIQEFAASVDEIDQCPTFDSAKKLIESKLMTKYKWNPKGEVYKDFIDTIERKYL